MLPEQWMQKAPHVMIGPENMNPLSEITLNLEGLARDVLDDDEVVHSEDMKIELNNTL